MKFDMIFGHILFAPDGGGSGGAEPKTTQPDGKKGSDPKEEFRQVAAELKSLMTASDERSEAELKEYREKLDKRLDDLEFSFDQKLKAHKVPAESKKYENADAFKAALYAFARKDASSIPGLLQQRGHEVKSSYHPAFKEVKSDNIVRFDQTTGGALLMPAEVSTDIIYNARETTPLAQLVNMTTTDRAQKVVTLRVGTPGIQWIGEEGTVEKKKMTYRTVTLTPKKAAARYGVSIEQEQDSMHDPIAEMQRAYSEDFAVGVGSAMLKGNGVEQPTGMLGKLTEFESNALALVTDDLIKLQEQILEVYQSSGSWLFTRKTRAYIRTLILSSTNGLQYTWEPDFQRKSPTLLLGAPVYIAKDSDLAGKVSGNFDANAIPIIFGDFRSGYELTMRSDMYVIDDPYSDSDSFVRNLSIMSRVDGKPTKTEALVALKMTA